MPVIPNIQSTSISSECVDNCAAAGFVSEGLQRFEIGGRRRFRGEKAALMELGALTLDCAGECANCPLGGIVAVKAFMRSQEALAIAKDASARASSRSSVSGFGDHTGLD